jgi:hypothetical protein
MIEYLYEHDRYGGWFRWPIVRETESNVWIQCRGRESMISKKTYRAGSDWNVTRYERESEEVVVSYFKDELIRDYKRKLDGLNKCRDEAIMLKVVGIEIPEVKL